MIASRATQEYSGTLTLRNPLCYGQFFVVYCPSILCKIISSLSVYGPSLRKGSGWASVITDKWQKKKQQKQNKKHNLQIPKNITDNWHLKSYLLTTDGMLQHCHCCYSFEIH